MEVTKRSGGDIIRDSNVWLDAISINLESDTLIGLPSFYRNTFRDESVVTQVATRWRELLELITDDGISDSEFERITPTYVDMERFIRWNAIATLFGSRHALAASNVRWYYDSSRGLFEPILYDVSSQSLGEFGGDPVTGEFRTTFEPLLSNPLVKRLLLIPSVMQRRNRYLWNLLHEIDVAAMLETEYERIRPFYAERKIKEDLVSSESFEEQYQTRQQTMAENRRIIETFLRFGRVFVDARVVSGAQPRFEIRITPDSLAILGLTRLSLAFGGSAEQTMLIPTRATLTSPDGDVRPVNISTVDDEGGRLAYSFDPLKFTPRFTHHGKIIEHVREQWLLSIEMAGNAVANDPSRLLSYELEFLHELTGVLIPAHLVRTSTLSVKYLDEGRRNPALRTLQTFLKSMPLPFAVDGDTLVLPAGRYSVSESLIIPASHRLRLSPGVELQMGPGATLVSYRGLTALGTAAAPIHIQRLDRDQAWGVVGIANAPERSQLSHVFVDGGSESWVNGIFFSGQICFYHSDVDIRNTTVTGAGADDALNIKHARFSIANSRFERNSVDGYDGDWVIGDIRGSIFVDNGGDGVDFSGSDVAIFDTLFHGMGDKALSVGEDGRALLVNSVVRESAIGLASKDLTDVDIVSSVFYANETGLSAYQKKQIFGAATVSVYGALFWNNTRDFEVDGGSDIRVAGSGLQKWRPTRRITGDELHVGTVSDYYQIEPTGHIRYVGGSDGDPLFASGPALPAALANRSGLDDLTNRPVGLANPLPSAP